MSEAKSLEDEACVSAPPAVPVPAKRGRGRPRDPRRPELEEKVLEYIRIGLSTPKAALAAGVPYPNIHWWENDDSFGERLAQARAEREAVWLQELAPGKFGWQAKAWLLERLCPEDYGKMDRGTVGGGGQQPLVLVGTLNVLQASRPAALEPPAVPALSPVPMPQIAAAPEPVEAEFVAEVVPEVVPMEAVPEEQVAEPESESESEPAPTPVPTPVLGMVPDGVLESRKRWG
jgi:hypothetical protein